MLGISVVLSVVSTALSIVTAGGLFILDVEGMEISALIVGLVRGFLAVAEGNVAKNVCSCYSIADCIPCSKDYMELATRSSIALFC